MEFVSTYPGFEDCELMEVDSVDVPWKPQVPHLASFEPLEATKETAPPPLALVSPTAPAAAISLFHQVKKPDLYFQPHLQQQQHQLQPAQQARRQQTNEPVRPPDEFCLAHDGDNSSGACPPSIDGFDALPGGPVSTTLPALSADDVEKEFESLNGSAAPCVPEVLDSHSQQLFLWLQQQGQTEERRRTISLMQEDSSSTSECLYDRDDGGDLMQELMDGDGDDDRSSDQCPSTCEATSVEHRQYDDASRHILEMHRRVAHDIPHAKKKPMLHEFLGYVLFRRAPGLAILHNSIYFCRENGDRLEPQRQDRHFRVAKFQAVSEVWKRVKGNSSKDCTKNMKRAMRMSTSNERKYFVNLTQRMHRMQIFEFGDRSLEFFGRAFPRGVDCQRRQ